MSAGRWDLTTELPDLADPALVADPYPYYAALRAAGGLHHSATWDAWLVTRYDLCHEVFSRPHDFDAAGQPMLRALQKGIQGGATSWRLPSGSGLTAPDPRQRAEGRRTTGRALTRPYVDRLWDGFAAECASTASELLDRAGTGPVDVVTEYAIPMATSLLANLMGVQPADLSVFRAWAESGYHDDLTDAQRGRVALDIRRLLANQAVHRLRNATDDFVGFLASNPAALPGHTSDVTAHLEFVLGTGLMISLVTHQGLVLSFSTLLRSLIAAPDQYLRLRRDRSLMASAVEEGLRYDPSTQALGRFARANTSLGGVDIPDGSLLVCFVGSANRDEAQWPAAATFDVSRDVRSTARHLTFGHGATSCLGAAMSRRALGYLLEALVERVGTIAPASGAQPFPEFMTRGFVSLPVELR
ncbi:Cytochrome P450 [Micromonospora viridifaciens]|uniref:Cytochrome P450 n=1 Tax=Micromonospora viridifaciens TaxID=1881 RepID=A0A1C4ZQ36_MICVI|nr:cytochrome P450 [Micromonospora viridifaciens]SCF35123.1 Cytochrome P450 [Micromonospora viridifaciens]